MKVTKLARAIGAQIDDVDLRNLDGETLSQIRKAFLEHCVVVFRGQHLTAEEHVAFARRMGDVMPYDGFKAFHDLPQGMIKLTNDGKQKVITENWHFDGTYYPVPPAVGILAPHRLPSLGGDTMWSNQYVAYERLSEGMKQLLNGLRCVCESNRASKKYGLDKVMSAVQPVVRRHPETGRLSLHVGNPDTFIHFVGMTREESEPIIRYLFDSCCQPDATYRHQWKMGDVLIWDNRCTMHFAIHDYGDEPRDMYRMTLKGEPAKGALDA